MSARRGWLGFVVVALIALAALLVSGSASITTRGFALGAPDQDSVALVRGPRPVCEGPVTSQGPVRSVGIWGASVVGLARLAVNVQDARTHRSLASGRISATGADEYTAHLDRTVSGGRPLRVCLRETLNTFSLLGSPAVVTGVTMTGGKPGQQFSLVLQDTRGSLLSALPTAFSRASLFRPSWVGSWTFLMLAAALLATIGLGAAAIASAGGDDENR